MEIRSRDIIVIFLIVIAAYFYWGGSDEKTVSLVEEELVAEEIQEEEVVELVREEPKKRRTEKPIPLAKPKTSQSPQAKYPHLDKSFVPFDEKGNRFITQIIQTGKHLLYHGDVLLGDSKDLDKLMKQKVVKQGRARKWTRGVIPYMIDESLPNYEKVMEAIEYLNIFTNVQLVPKGDHENYVYITVGESDCYSYAGMIGGMQEIFLTPKCGVREILHEFMHTIGFFHEQNREDRDKYIKIVWENIDENNKTQFKKIPNDFIGLVSRPFDFKSIMIYSSFTFSASRNEPVMLTVEGEVLPQLKSLLSEEDIKRVNLAYPKS